MSLKSSNFNFSRIPGPGTALFSSRWCLSSAFAFQWRCSPQEWPRPWPKRKHWWRYIYMYKLYMHRDMIDEKRNAAPSAIRFGSVQVGSFTFSEKSLRGHLGDGTSLPCVYIAYPSGPAGDCGILHFVQKLFSKYIRKASPCRCWMREWRSKIKMCMFFFYIFIFL